MNDTDEKYDEMTLYASQNQQDQRAIFKAREDTMKQMLVPPWNKVLQTRQGASLHYQKRYLDLIVLYYLSNSSKSSTNSEKAMLSSERCSNPRR